MRVANNPKRRRQMLPPALYNQGGLAAFVFGSDGQDPDSIFGTRAFDIILGDVSWKERLANGGVVDQENQIGRIAPEIPERRRLRFMIELRSDLEDPDRSTLLIAFREILLNAIEHGAGFDSEKVIEVDAVRTKRAIVYRFRDPGPGFRGKPLPHAAINNPPDNPIKHLEFREAQGLRPGGFGILLTQQLVDELIFNEMGNEVLLIKHTA